MDFSTLDSRTAASRPGKLHLRHPATGVLMYNDDAQEEPCIVLVRGMESPEFQKGMSHLQRDRLVNDLGQSPEELHARAVESAKLLVTGFMNMFRSDDNGQLRPMNLSDVEWFLNLQMVNGNKGEKSFVEQVTAFASKRANFLGKD